MGKDKTKDRSIFGPNEEFFFILIRKKRVENAITEGKLLLNNYSLLLS